MTDQPAFGVLIDAAAAERHFADIREQSRADRHFESLITDLRSLLNTMDPRRRQDLTTLTICLLLLNLPDDARDAVLGQFSKPVPAANVRRRH